MDVCGVHGRNGASSAGPTGLVRTQLFECGRLAFSAGATNYHITFNTGRQYETQARKGMRRLLATLVAKLTPSGI